MQQIVLASSQHDEWERAKALGTFDTLPVDEQVKMVTHSIMRRLRKVLDDVQDLQQLSRDEAAERVISVVRSMADSEPTR